MTKIIKSTSGLAGKKPKPLYKRNPSTITIDGISSNDKHQIKKFANEIKNHGLENHDLKTGDHSMKENQDNDTIEYVVTDMFGRPISNTRNSDISIVKSIRNALAKKYNEIFKIEKVTVKLEGRQFSEIRYTEDMDCGSSINSSDTFAGFTPESLDNVVTFSNSLKKFKDEATNSIRESIIDIPHKEYCSDVLTDNDKLQPSVRKQILSTIKKWQDQLDFDFEIKKIVAKGSLFTKRYTDTTDLDVTLYTDLSQEELDEIFDIIPKGQNIEGTQHPIDFYILIDGEDVPEKNFDNAYDVEKNKWIKRTAEYDNELPLEYVMQTCNFFINGCVIALNNYDNDKILYEYYSKITSEKYDISNNELQTILEDKKNDLLADLDGLKVAAHMISSFRREAYEEEPNIFSISIEILNDNAHNSINEQLSKIISKFGILEKLRNAIKECEELLDVKEED